MKTVVTKKVESATLKLQLGYWDEEIEEFIPITNESVGEAAAHLDCSEELVRLLLVMTGDVATTIHSDLKDIWKRLDDLEAKLQAKAS